MKPSDTVAMTVEEALTHSDEWTKGQTFYPGAQGWRVVCAVLAAEVRRLRAEKADSIAKVEDLQDEYGSIPRYFVLQILRGKRNESFVQKR